MGVRCGTVLFDGGNLLFSEGRPGLSCLGLGGGEVEVAAFGCLGTGHAI